MLHIFEQKKKIKMAATKKEKQKVITGTTSIVLNVPNDLYFDIKTKADGKTFSTGNKHTIHDAMIDDLKKQNPKK